MHSRLTENRKGNKLSGKVGNCVLCKDVMAVIEDSYAGSYALEWDNVGLLVGREDKQVRKIFVALDATDEVIEAAAQHGADLLVTHHPLIFGGMKRITSQDFIGRRVLRLAQQDIAYYAMHTNYDVIRMGKLAADRLGLGRQEILDVTCEWQPADGDIKERYREGIGRSGYLEEPVSLEGCCERVKRAFSLEAVRVFGDLKRQVYKAAVCPGAGKSVIRAAIDKNADVLITGDIGHHEGIDAIAQGMAVIDAGHYGLEHIFLEDMKEYLEERITGAEVLAMPVKHPYANI